MVRFTIDGSLVEMYYATRPEDEDEQKRHIVLCTRRHQMFAINTAMMINRSQNYIIWSISDSKGREAAMT